MALEKQRLTVEAFWEQYAGQPYELVDGEAVYVAPAGYEASNIALRLGAYLILFVEENDLGGVTAADGGYTLDDDNMRAPDVAYVRKERLVTQPDLKKFVVGAPDLAAEVVSPTDRAADVQNKVRLYLERGVRLVWVVYPGTREVVIHRPDRTAQTLTATDMLNGEDVLPGFTLPLATLFHGISN